jgi:ribosome maturation factor RimP
MPPATAGRSADSAAATRQHLRELLGPVVASAGYDLDDVTVTAAGRRNLIRVSVDADGGIDLDAVAAVTRLVSETLDAQDTGAEADNANGAFAGPYVLEVSSPGVDRPLTEPRHWHRAVGRLVEVPIGNRPVTGRVTGASSDGVTLDLRGVQRQLTWSELGLGRVQVEFNPPGAADDTGTKGAKAPKAVKAPKGDKVAKGAKATKSAKGSKGVADEPAQPAADEPAQGVADELVEEG